MGNHKVYNNAQKEDTDSYFIGNLNPFRYRSYYFDTETKLYYLKTRYYDPEVGRFINMDSIEYADPQTINGLNLYSYCGNNPVINIDPDGHAWWKWLVVAAVVVAAVAFSVATAGVGATIVAGAIGVAVGLGTELISDIADDGQINNGWENYVGAAVGGLVSGLAGGVVSSMVLGGAGDVVSGLISGEVTSFADGAKTFATSALISGGLALGAGALKRGLSKMKYSKIVGNSTSNIKINNKLKTAGFGDVKIGRDGLDAVLTRIGQSRPIATAEKIFSNVVGFGIGVLKNVI